MGLIAVGDIHGCVGTIRKLLDRLQVGRDDHVIFIGDYIDRGPDSKGVIDFLLDFRDQATCTFLRGNHEELMLGYLDNGEYEVWAFNGGVQTLESYRQEDGSPHVPDAHVEFIRSTELYLETDDFFFVHAGLRADMTIGENLEFGDEEIFLWERSHMDARSFLWEKPVICGHTPVPHPVDREKLINIDTGCVFHGRSDLGKLTAVRLPEREFVVVPYAG